MTDRARLRERHRRLALEVVLLVMACVLGLWGLDAASRVGAQTLLERNLQEVTGVAERPRVTLRDGFFLPQVIRGAYEGATVEISDVRTGPLTVARVRADLEDIRLPLADLLLRDLRRVGVGRAEEIVTVRFADLNAYFEATGRNLTLAVGDDGQVDLAGSFDVLGQTVPVSAVVELSADGSQLRVTPRDIDTGDVTLSAAGRLLLDQRIALTVPLDGLPFGSQLTGLEITPDSVVITATSSGIVLRP